MRPAPLLTSCLLHAAAATALFLTVSGGEEPAPPARVRVLPSRPAVASVPREAEPEPVAVEPTVHEPQPPPETPLPVDPQAFAPEPPPPPPERRSWRPWWTRPLDRRVTRWEDPQPVEPAVAAPESAPLVEAEPLTEQNEPPGYPERARRRGHQGLVRIAVEVDAEGRVVDLRLAAACRHPELNRAALRAVRTWRFRPARREGRPVPSETVVEVEFRLTPSEG